MKYFQGALTLVTHYFGERVVVMNTRHPVLLVLGRVIFKFLEEQNFNCTLSSFLEVLYLEFNERTNERYTSVLSMEFEKGP